MLLKMESSKNILSQKLDVIRGEISQFLKKEDSVLLNALLAGNILCGWLSFQQCDFHLRSDVLKLISRACSSHADRETHCEFIQRLVSLKAPLITFVSMFLSSIQGQPTDSDVVSLLKLIFDVVLSIYQCLPVSSMDFIDVILPQLQLILKKHSDEMARDLENNVAELLQLKENISSQENSSQGESKKEEVPPPPCNFRDISLLPDKQEIESQARPYLRANVVKGPYENVDHYLDIQFRLMREDMFRFLREGVAEYKSQEWPRDSSALLQNGHIYFDAEISSRKYFNGIFFIADVHIGRAVDWDTTKRLMSNSLLCMSSDGFKTFIFTHVHSRAPSQKKLSCLLQFSVADGNDAEGIELGKLYDIIETTSFYESYRYVLRRLQLFDDENFPLSSSILFLKDCDKRPEYWEYVSSELTMQSETDTFQRMLKSQIKHFDEHQQHAFQMALSNRVSMIQGPPGTGKTYLGLQIVKWLLENASRHMSTPVVVICYTNHALDQFLEGVLTFTQKVVRIGGQSKNISLETYHISNIVNALLKRHSEDEPLEENELKSRMIGLKILNRSCVLQRVGRYTVNVRQTEKRLAYLEQLIYQLSDNSFYNETMLLLILPKDLRQEILGWLDSYKTLSSLTKFLIRALENWLCISVSFLFVYEDEPGLMLTIINELLYYIKENGYLDRKIPLEKRSGKQNQTFMTQENQFIIGLWDKFLKTENLASVDAMKTMPVDIDHYVQYFLREHALEKKIVFKFLEKAASKCLEQSGDASKPKAHQMWSKSLLDRWAIFSEWKSDLQRRFQTEVSQLRSTYVELLNERENVRSRNNIEIAEKADIIGLTTTGAAKHWKMLEQIRSRVVIAEEAAEVLEAHITTALTKFTKHLILIGDHKQLRPIPSVYDLAKKFKLDISMFERLVTSGAPSRCLQTQHRMRPCIAELLVPEIYDNLENHPSVLNYENVKGVTSNMYFIQHQVYEDSNPDLRSHRNKHEAYFLISLCRYLLQQGYEESSITILTTYAGQLKLLDEVTKRKLKKDVRVTTVDNFQGEENDIILLSFVRSNWKNSLGFIGITNRICVALSRARKGLFCIGNFDSFAEKCDVWRKITEKLREMQLISPALPLKCQNHPTNITRVSCASDFDKVLNGGCMEKCIYSLACGHECPLRCHLEANKHNNMTCSKKCQNRHREENPNVPNVVKNTSKEFPVVKSTRNADENKGDDANELAGSFAIVKDQCGIVSSGRISPSSYVNHETGTDVEINDCVNNLSLTSCNSSLSSEESLFAATDNEDNFHEDSSGTDLITMTKPEEMACSEALHADFQCAERSINADSRNDRRGSETKIRNEAVVNRQHIKETEGQSGEDNNFSRNPVSLNDPPTQSLGSKPLVGSYVQETALEFNSGDFVEKYYSSRLCSVTNRDSTTHTEDNELKAFSSAPKTFTDCKASSLKETNSVAITLNTVCNENFYEIAAPTFAFIRENDASFVPDVGINTNKCTSDCICSSDTYKDEKIDGTINNRLNCCTKSENLHRGNKGVVPSELVDETPLSAVSLDCKMGADFYELKRGKTQRDAEQFLRRRKYCDTQESDCDESKLDWKTHFGLRHVVDSEKKLAHFDDEPCDHVKNRKIQCDALILKKLPCQHETSVSCNKYNLQQKCTSEVEVQLPCLHSLSITCGDWIWKKEIRCAFQDTISMPCGKVIQYICSEGPSHADCTAVVLKCGHRVPCYTDVDNYKCEVPVKCLLPCSHSIDIPCTLHYYSQKPEAIKKHSISKINKHQNSLLQKMCGKRCDFLMKCGHRCLGKCGDCTKSRKHTTCYELVKRDLPCGYQMEYECHVKDFFCPKRCDFPMECGHRCSGKCGSCTSNGKHYDCEEIVSKDLPCGHQLKCKCSIKDPFCTVKCETVLSCGHQCPGECGQCFKLQIHDMCTEIVNRNLFCGHSVEWTCGSPLPACERRCLFGCQHSRCINPCQYPCIKCSKPCEWQCEHLSCSMRCGELCNRPPCNVRCPLTLACGHQCVGYCGEPCPSCLLCSNGLILDTQGNSNWYVLLENCQHSILMQNLDSYFKQKSPRSCPLCPDCGTVITRNKRYGNFIRSWLMSKPQNYRMKSCDDESESLERPISFKTDHEICTKFLSQMIEMNISLEFTPEAMKMCRNIHILRHMMRTKFFLHSCDLLAVSKSLEQWLLEHGAICSEQQVEDSCRAVRRLCVQYFAKLLIARQRVKNSNATYTEIINLLESKPFDESAEERMVKVLRESVAKVEGTSVYILFFIHDLNVIQNSARYKATDFSKYFGKLWFRSFLPSLKIKLASKLRQLSAALYANSEDLNGIQNSAK